MGGVGAGLAALTRLPVGWIRAGLFVMILGTKFWLGLGIYAIAALVVPHRGALASGVEQRGRVAAGGVASG